MTRESLDGDVVPVKAAVGYSGVCGGGGGGGCGAMAVVAEMAVWRL